MDSNEFNIVFMGTPSFALPSLKGIIEEGYNVNAVVSAPDRPAGRGRKIRKSAVSEFALEQGLTLLRPELLRDEELLTDIRDANPHLIVVVAFRMLPDTVWQLPPFGTINLHASLLPQYRGAAPINWALMNGEEETGLTTFFIDKDIDTGRIIDRKKVGIGEQTTAGELHDEMMHVGAELLLESLRKIRTGEAVGSPQSKFADEFSQLRPAPKITREHCRIDWKRSSTEVHNKVRGLSPSPGAYTELQLSSGSLQRVKIFRGTQGPDTCQDPPGTLLIRDKQLLVSCGSGCYEILELQLAGKARVPAEAFMHGLPGGFKAMFQ